MEDNTETTEEMSLGSLDRIPERKLLAFFFGQNKLSFPIWEGKIYFCLINKDRKELITRLKINLSLESYFKL